MTGDELMAYGFKRSEPSRAINKHADWMYQFRVNDETGIRYFVTVCEYVNEYRSNSFEADVYYNDGCEFFPTESCLMLKIYGTVSSWTVEQLMVVADELWNRLDPRHYE